MDSGYAITVISTKKPGPGAYLKKVCTFHSMIVLLARRDIKIKYAQTLLGIVWAIIQPLTGLLIFTIFFDRLIKLDTNGIPYPLFAFTGMVSWFYFSNIIYGAGTALKENQNLIKKIYFPKLVLLFAKVLVASVDFFISLVLLFIFLLVLKGKLSWSFFLLPFFIAFNIIVGLSIAIWISALTVKYRDLQHIVPYIVGFGIWLTPVFYPGTLIPGDYKLFLFLNPMAATIAAFRWSIIGGAVPDAGYLLSCIPVLFLLITGLSYFRQIENEISDYI